MPLEDSFLIRSGVSKSVLFPQHHWKRPACVCIDRWGRACCDGARLSRGGRRTVQNFCGTHVATGISPKGDSHLQAWLSGEGLGTYPSFLP